jgi:UDP-3-O-acyl N-acetylglucosamine deacetylase
MPDDRQSTLKAGASMQGRGLHTGEACCVTLRPAEEDAGVVFVTRQGEIRACARNVCDTLRGTSLRDGETVVHTVEHLLAALAGMQVDNALVEIEGPELPAGDGSALPFVELIEEAGVAVQQSKPMCVRLHEPVWTSSEDKCLLAVPDGSLRLNTMIGFSHPMIGEQAISLRVNPEVFKKEIAPARTFCTASEIEAIFSLGLGKGGSDDNVIVVYEDRYSVPLRFDDEFVRHKTLDLIGDLSLIGGRLYAEVTAIKPSHALNVSLAQNILRKADA